MNSFLTTGHAYDGYMGRYSRPLATLFADSAGVAPGWSALDVGCGPGALTRVLADRLGPERVSAADPSPPFVAECAAALPGVTVRAGRAEDLPFGDAAFDCALAQLVIHFVADPHAFGRELRRVVRPGGVAAACVWDFAGGMQMLRLFWDAALTIDPSAPDEARTLKFGRDGEIAAWLAAAGFTGVTETVLSVSSTYASFDELWNGYLAGIGPAGVYCVGLPDDQRTAVRAELFRRLGSPTGSFTLSALARSASGRNPG
ncbi:class I SAM-dependent methyltransferase [Cryptosporangium arvum]|uniref:Methylase involved in ubiquinone/menaquinone biosynthesis n=1 Tax=Cryptosporangium arvum DSM 44712 TaxID=927661 RepID=A0A010ZT78_9ACTN|nr:class I SAM-dependent methyltransferase [Cryptosporangium arvum]EXG81904.1 methylase involved in ubiquinone/menaquinone biosynthesis [Cryptosporangium arvum DSM 44712]